MHELKVNQIFLKDQNTTRKNSFNITTLNIDF